VGDYSDAMKVQPLVLRWSSGAAALMTALRASATPEGFLHAEAAFYGLIFGPPVGTAITSGLLRDYAYGLDPARTSRERNNSVGPGVGVTGLELEIESAARLENCRTVGERHVIDVVIARLQGSGSPYLVQGDRLREAVREIELGHGFAPGELEGRWHGLLDTSVIIQGRDIDSIDWHEETHSREVVLWAGLSLLNELDLLGYTSRIDRVRNRVRLFVRWLTPRLDEGTRPPGHLLRPGTYLRVWGETALVGARDTDHLETALALRERGVAVELISFDLGMLGRAKLLGVPTHRLNDRWALPAPGPTE
jgi:hypothetical protein